jgi:Response regulator containing CheY-like receiver, AAA-type ATPase, and DNA-binding domains
MRKNILVVDDEPMVLEVTARMLRQSGFIVEEASGGADALKLLQKERTNLLITDIQMPGMNGIELVLKTRERYPDLEVIALSAYGTEATQDKLRRIGVFGYVEKPINPEHLAEMARNAIKSNRAVRLGLGRQEPLLSFNKERILVVDDNVDIIEILSRILSNEGYRVTTARDGSIAYEKILVNDYDLVIMDINMPKMNGIETVKAIREDDPDTYILLMSGEAESHEIKEAIANGANKFMPKPLDLDALLAVIKKIDFKKINKSKQKGADQDRETALRNLTWFQKLFHPYRIARIRHEMPWILFIIIFSLLIGAGAVFISENSPGKSDDETGINLKEKVNTIEGYLNRDEQRELKHR